MASRTRSWLAAALGVCMATPHVAPASEPPPLPIRPGDAVPAVVPSRNQRTADAIADQLRQSGALRGYLVDVAFQAGVARLTGSVADQPQREEVVRIVQGVPGVERVQDRLTTRFGVSPVAAEEPPAPLPPAPPGEPPPLRRNDDPIPAPVPAPEGVPAPALVEPAPIFQAPPASPYDLNPPRMPGYAWPTYAPYNNYSRVAYPLAYPYNAFPFIGPCYPFPKVPLGWRSVKLEWDDGYWWFGKTATKYNWWHLRYW